MFIFLIIVYNMMGAVWLIIVAIHCGTCQLNHIPIMVYQFK